MEPATEVLVVPDVPDATRPSSVSARLSAAHPIVMPDWPPSKGSAKQLWPPGHALMVYLPSGPQLPTCPPMHAWPPAASPALQGESLVIVAKTPLKPSAISTFALFVLDAFERSSGVPVFVELAELDELDVPDGY